MSGARSIPGTGAVVSSELSTVPLPAYVSDRIRNSNRLANQNSRALTFSTAESPPSDTLIVNNPVLELVDPGTPGDFTVDGIRIYSESGTGPETEASRVVSIIADASRDDIRNAIEEKSRGPQPIIMSFHKIPEISSSDMDAIIETSHFENQIVKESLVRGYSKVKSESLQELGKQVEEEARQSLKIVDERLAALSYMLDIMNLASTGLNISKTSDQIMQRASDVMSEVVIRSESTNSPLPGDLDDYISLTFRNNAVSGNVDRYLTNTSRMIVLAQDVMMSCLSAHPTLLAKFTRGNTSSLSNIFSVPGSYGYSTFLTSRTRGLPTVKSLFARNTKSIIYSFGGGGVDIDRSREGSRTLGDIADLRSKKRTNPGFLSSGVTAVVSQDEMWDDICHSVCALSNELILSAGIGRLRGTRLGNRYMMLDEPRGSEQVDPFSKIFGFNPTSSADEISRFFTTGPRHQGSFLDYLALGEEREDTRGVVIMPFEVDTAIKDGTYYVAGHQYFIDLPVHPDRANIRSALADFSSKYTSLTNDMSAYLTELMALDVETSLSPEIIVSRVLQDFLGILTSFSEGRVDSEKSALVAALFSICGYKPNNRSIETSYTGPRGAAIRVTVSDLLKMSVITAIHDFDRLSDGDSYALSGASTSDIGLSTGLLDRRSNEGSFSDENLKNAIDQLGSIGSIITRSRRNIVESIGSRSIDSSSVSRVFYYSHNESESRDYLHDGSFASKTNLVNLIARTVRELQKEALNLSQRSGSEADYRNPSGGSNMSNCDEDRLIDVVCTIYMNLAYLLLPIALVKESDPVVTPDAGANWKVGMVYNQDASRRGKIIISDMIESLVKGLPISSSDVFNRTLLDPETTISLSPVGIGGDNTAVTSVASLIDVMSRFSKHRYYIRAGLKILESVAASVSSASSSVLNLFKLLNDEVKRKDLKGPDLALYDMFVTDLSTNSDLLKNISENQLNLCVSARSIYGDPSSPDLRKDITSSTSERLALRDFVRSICEVEEGDELYVVSVGCPKGLIDSLYNGSFESRSNESLAAFGSERSNRSRFIKIEFDQFDNAYINPRTGVHSKVLGSSPETEFDPEIFVLSDSISYDPMDKSPNALTVFDAIFLSTKFYRLRHGRIFESFMGSETSPSVARFCRNALRSYLLDLYLYDTHGTRYIDGISPPGAPRLSQAGYRMLSTASSDPTASRELMSKGGFSSLYDPTTRRVRTGAALRSLITSSNPRQIPVFTELDIKIAAALSCLSPLSDITDTIRLRPLERIYHILFNENIARQNISGDVSASLDGLTPGVKALRSQFDIYSLSARVIRGSL